MGMPDSYPFRSAQAQADYTAWYDRRIERWPAPKETRMIKTAHGQTCVHINGSPNAPPIVLLPGMGSSSFSWMAFIGEWSKHYCTYALDSIYDYGRSVASMPVRREDLTGWLEAVLAELGLGDGIHLMGISLGAWLSAQYALRHPERLRKLVWLAPVGIVMPVSWKGMARALLSNLSPQRFLRPFLAWMSPDLQSSGTNGQAITDEVIDEILLARRCFRPMPIIAPTVLSDAELGRLSPPTLCLMGEHERFQSAPKAMARLQRVAPQICAEIVPRAGHDLTAIQVGPVSQRVLAFLEQDITSRLG